MRITNIRFAWANEASRRPAFIAAVTDDIASAVGVSRDAVTITAIREGSVIVDFEIHGSSESETDNAVSIFDAQITTGAVPLLTTETFVSSDPVTAKEDESAALGLESTPAALSAATSTAFPVASAAIGLLLLALPRAQ